MRLARTRMCDEVPPAIRLSGKPTPAGAIAEVHSNVDPSADRSGRAFEVHLSSSASRRILGTQSQSWQKGFFKNAPTDVPNQESFLQGTTAERARRTGSESGLSLECLPKLYQETASSIGRSCCTPFCRSGAGDVRSDFTAAESISTATARWSRVMERTSR